MPGGGPVSQDRTVGFLSPRKTPATGIVSCDRSSLSSNRPSDSVYSQPSSPTDRIAAKVTVSAIAFFAIASSQALLGSHPLPAQSTALPKVQAYQSDSFVDSIGVVTHLTYTDTNYYEQWPTVFNDLQSLGVRHIRDGYYDWAAGTPFFSEHQQLMSAGIKTDYVIPFNTSTTAATIKTIAKKVTDMEAVEAPNECDIAGNCGSTETESVNDMLSILPTIDKAGIALDVPILGPSFANYTSYAQVGNISSKMTYNNLHVYFGGRNPGSSGWGGLDSEGNSYGSIPFWLDMGHEDAPGVPAMITETGYMMFPSAQQYTIPPSTGASYLPRTLLLAYSKGVKRTYMYELLDEVSSPGYGLIDENMNPKPAFLAVQNLIANLWDQGASFTPGQLAYSLSDGDFTVKQVLFQKRDGSFWLAVWLEQSSYDEVNLDFTPVATQNLTINVASNYSVTNIGALDDTGNMNWTSPAPAGSKASFRVSDQVTLVKILPNN